MTNQEIRFRIPDAILVKAQQRAEALGLEGEPGKTGGVSALARRALYKELGLKPPEDPHEQLRQELTGRKNLYHPSKLTVPCPECGGDGLVIGEGETCTCRDCDYEKDCEQCAADVSQGETFYCPDHGGGLGAGTCALIGDLWMCTYCGMEYPIEDYHPCPVCGEWLAKGGPCTNCWDHAMSKNE